MINSIIGFKRINRRLTPNLEPKQPSKKKRKRSQKDEMQIQQAAFIIPEDIVEHIFKFLPPAAIYKLAPTCKMFAKQRMYIKKLSFYNSQVDFVNKLYKKNGYICKKLEPNHLLSMFRSSNRVCELNFHFPQSKFDFQLQHVNTLLMLKHLTLSNCFNIVDERLKIFTSLPLESLKLDYCPNITDKGLMYIGSVKTLKYLKISSSDKITNNGLKHLKSLMHLEKLAICACSRIDNAGLDHLKSLPLKTLAFENCRGITDEGLAKLALLPIERLFIIDCPRVTRAGVKHFEPLKLKQILWRNRG